MRKKTKERRLVFITQLIYPYRVGGAEVFNYYLMRTLKNDVKVVCINSYVKGEIEAITHVKIRLPLLQPLLFPALSALTILKLHVRSSPHLVLSFGRSRWFYWVLYPLFNLLFGTKYTIVIHGGGLKKWKFKTPFKWLFRRAENIVGVSDRISKEYSARTGRSILTIPPLVPFEVSELNKEDCRARFGLPNDAKLIIMVGSLIDIKCTDTAIQALGHLGANYLSQHNIVLVLAGDGVKRTQFESEAAKLNVDGRVKFLGNVPRDSICHLYRAADIYVMASKYEGTPISMLEAMVNQLPVAASDAPGINAVARNGHNALLFPVKDSQKLSEILRKLVEDKELCTQLEKNAGATMEATYNYGSMIEKYRTLFGL